MANRISARTPRADLSANSTNQPGKRRLQKAARFAVEALEGRVLLTSTWTNLSNASPSFDVNGNWNTAYPNAASAVANMEVATTVSENISLGTAITVGSLTLGHSGSGSETEVIVADGNNLTFNNGSSAATLTLSGNNGATIDAPISLSSNLTISNSTNGILTINGAINVGTHSVTVSGNGAVVINGAITGSGSVIVNDGGGGTLTLSGSNGYSGGTTFSAGGTLLLTNTSGSATGSNSVTISNNGVLGGTGIATGAVTISSGKLTPTVGGSAILSLGSLSLGSSAEFDATLNSDTAGSGYAQVDVAGTVSINSNAQLQLGGSLAAHDGAALDLIDSTGGITGAFHNLAQGATTTLNSVTYTANYTAAGSDDFALTSSLASTSTALSASPDNPTTAQSSTLTATVTSSLSGTPTGNVTFYDGSTSLGTSALNGSAVATLVYSSFPAGNNQSITAVYGGDSYFAGSTSSGRNINVTLATPNAPTGLAVTGVTSSSIALGWTAPNAATSYSVLAEPSGGSYTTIATGVTATTYTNTGLSADSTYSYEVKATNSVGTSSASTAVSGTTLCGVPTSPSATASGTQIALGWTAPTGGASSYNVYRYNGTAYVKINGSAVTSPAYTDTGLTAGNTYSYEVTAVNSAGEGTATGSFGATLLPPAPTGVTATLSGSSVVVSWTAANGATSYSIARNDNPTLATGVTSIPYTDSTVVSGGTYAYTVFALNAGGTSSGTTSSSIALAPAAPASLSITAATASSITLGWSASSGATSYHILEEQDIDGVTSYNVVESTASTSDTVSGLTGDTSYSFEVTAINAAGCSPAVGPQSTGTPPDAPTGLSSIGADSNSISLTWDIVTDAANYTVLRENSGGTSYSAIAADPISGTTVVDSGLTADATYSYEVEVTTSNGTSVGSAPISVTTAPAAPTGLTATAEDTQTLLSWTASTGATSYNIYQYNGSAYVNVTNTAAVTFNGATSAVVTGLTNGTSYSYEVSAVSDAGEGSLSSSASVTPAVSTVEFLTATPASTSEIDLAWNLNTIGAQNIEVDRSPDGSTWTAVTTTLPGTATSYADTGLSENTQYYYQVRAIYPDTTTSAFSVPASASTLPAITGFTATASSASEIDLGWTTNITDATGIEVYRSTDGGDTFSLLASLANTATSYSDTGLTESSAYYYQINAITADGSSEEVASANATTPATPAAVDTLSASAASMSEIDLSWNLNDTSATAVEVDRSANGGTTWTMLTNTLSPSTTTYADTGLADNTDYTYQVRAIYADSSTSAFSAPADATTTAAVYGLTATTTSTTEIDLSWNLNIDTSDITNVPIYRSVDGGAYTFLTDSDLTLGFGEGFTSYADTSVVAGHDYSYEVQAETSSSTTSLSDAADASTVAFSNLTYTPDTSSQALTWTNLATDGTSIEVDRSANGTTYSALTTSLSGYAGSYTDTTASENTEYWYKVTLNEPGGSTTLGPIDTFTLPAAPTDVTVTNDTPTEVDLSWVNPGSSSTPFFIERSGDAGADFAIIGETAAGATNYQDTTVTDGISYVYQVDAVSGDGYNDNPASATVTAYTPLAAPTQLTLTPNGPTEMDLSWNNPSQTATGYEVQREIPGGSWSTIGDVDYADTTYYSDTGEYGPVAGTQYLYQVLATDGDGNYSAASNVVTGVTAPSISISTTAGPTILEGDVYTLDTSVPYASGEVDPITGWTINWGDGTYTNESGAANGDPGSFTHIFTTTGFYTITASTIDGSFTGTENVEAEYDSSDTAADRLSASVTGSGSSYSLAATYTDPAGQAVTNWIVSWGDGTVEQPGGGDATSVGTTDNPDAASYSLSLTHSFPSSEVTAYYDVTVWAGTSENWYEYAQTVEIAASGETPPHDVVIWPDSDGAFPSYYVTMPDVPLADTGDLSINWGDGSSGTTWSPDEVPTSADHTYATTGEYIVTVTDSADDTVSEQVVQTALHSPTFTGPGNQVLNPGQAMSGDITYTGVAADDPVTATIDFGDGTGPRAVPLTDGAFDLSEIDAPSGLADLGSYTTNLTLNNTTVGASGYTPASAASFTTDVWSVVLDTGESNDLLIASSDGTQNLQELAVNVPRPGGEAVNVTITSTDPSQNDVWTTGTPVAGTDTPVIGSSASSYTFVLMPGVTTADFWTGATDGNTTAGVLSFSVTAAVDTADSTSTFLTQLAGGGPSLPPTWLTPAASVPANQLAVKIVATTNPNGYTLPIGGNVTGATRDWLVGQLVDLTAVVTSPPALSDPFIASALFTYSWTVPGNTLYSYSDDDNGARQASLEPRNVLFPALGAFPAIYADPPTGTAQREIQFFWLNTDGRFGSADDQTVGVTVSGKVGNHWSSVAESTSFAVQEPDSGMDIYDVGSVIKQVAHSDGTTWADLSGLGAGGTAYGIGIGGSVSIPADIAAAPGQWKFVQLVDSNYDESTTIGGFILAGAHLSTYGGYWLDTQDPYPTGVSAAGALYSVNSPFMTGTANEMVDSPGVELIGPSYIAGNAFFAADFKTYLMFQPTGGECVPVMYITWHVHYAVTKNLAAPAAAPTWTISGIDDPSPSGPDPSEPTAALEEPLWNHNAPRDLRNI